MELLSPRSRSMGRAAWAFARANWRYWPGIAPVAREELRRWQQRAARIEQPQLRELALAKLREEGFNAQAAAVLATGVRRRERRRGVTRALVALTVLYDFLDGVTELPSVAGGSDPVGDGLEVSRALGEAVALTAPPLGSYFRRWSEGGGDGGYLAELVGAVRAELVRLPASTAVADVLNEGAARCAEAQVRAHTAASLGGGQALAWAEGLAGAAGMQARDYLAGAASSVLALNAVIAGCADDGFTLEQAVELDQLYLLVSVLPTLLDSTIDQADDRDGGGFLRWYEDRLAVASAVARTVDEAVARAGRMPGGGQHLMILAGIVGYYTSHPGARREFAQPVVRAARDGLGALGWAVLAVVYAWRGARRLHRAGVITAEP